MVTPAGEPLSVTARMRCATPVGQGLLFGRQTVRQAAVTATVALAVSPCEIVTAAMFAPGTNPASI